MDLDINGIWQYPLGVCNAPERQNVGSVFLGACNSMDLSDCEISSDSAIRDKVIDALRPVIEHDRELFGRFTVEMALSNLDLEVFVCAQELHAVLTPQEFVTGPTTKYLLDKSTYAILSVSEKHG